MTRAEFTKSTKLAAFDHYRGRCAVCTAKLFPGNIEFHHATECTYEGDNSQENCIPLCRSCHRVVTNKRAADIAKSNRMRNRHLGIKRTGKPLMGTRASGWRKRMDGRVERR